MKHRRQQFDAETRRKVYESGRRYAFGWDQHRPPAARQKDEDMAGYNKTILMGNLTRDPQLKYLPSQTAVAEFGIAINRKFRTQQGEDREEVTFVDCAAFGKTADVINQYFTKGKPIFIEGRLKYESWDDKQGGGKRSKLTVVVDNFQFVGGRDGDTADGSGREIDRSTSQEQPRGRSGGGNMFRRPAGAGARQQQPEAPFSENQEFKEEDIPF